MATNAHKRMSCLARHIFPEPVTVMMNSEMRDEVDARRESTTRKTSTDERATANSVIRVAIRLFLERVRIAKGDGPNTEEEVLDVATKRVLGANKSWNSTSADTAEETS